MLHPNHSTIAIGTVQSSKKWSHIYDLNRTPVRVMILDEVRKELAKKKKLKKSQALPQRAKNNPKTQRHKTRRGPKEAAPSQRNLRKNNSIGKRAVGSNDATTTSPN